MREDRLLRLVAEQARNRTWTRERPSDHSLRRARRGLELVLPRRGGVYVRAAVALPVLGPDLSLGRTWRRSDPRGRALAFVHRARDTTEDCARRGEQNRLPVSKRNAVDARVRERLAARTDEEHARISFRRGRRGGPLDASESKDAVERPRHLGEIERLDQQTRVSDLPAAATAHEPPKLLLIGPSLPRRLLLEGAEGSEVALSVDDLFHGGGTERADQLVLEVCDAHVEAEPFHVGASDVGAEAGTLESTLEVALLRGVAEARQPGVQALRAQQIEEASDGLRTPDRHDRNALGVKIPTTALGQRLQRELVSDPLDKHDRVPTHLQRA